MEHPTCIIEGLACWLTLCILEKIICNSTNSVQISFIETLKLIVFSWTIWWCYWQNVLMINEKNNFLTVSWLSGLLSAEIFISTGEWGVQMPPLTSENSYFLRSGPQGATLVMQWTDLNVQQAPPIHPALSDIRHLAADICHRRWISNLLSCLKMAQSNLSFMWKTWCLYKYISELIFRWTGNGLSPVWHQAITWWFILNVTMKNTL